MPPTHTHLVKVTTTKNLIGKLPKTHQSKSQMERCVRALRTLLKSQVGKRWSGGWVGSVAILLEGSV